MADLPYLIWSNYHQAWFRPKAAGYTDRISTAGIFTDRKVDPERERKIYQGQAYPEILRRRGELIRELGNLTSMEEALFGGTEAIRIARVSDRSIDDLELSVRSINCLRIAGITTIGDLASKSREELLSLRHFGRRSLREVVEVLDNVGLELRRVP
jgi:DNA-directed RNA polymerase alpha subunit